MKADSQEVSGSVASLLKFLAYAAWGSGLLYTIITGVALDYVDGGARAAQFFFGLVLTLPAGGLLYGLSYGILLYGDRSDNA
jgi:hypothetical protein